MKRPWEGQKSELRWTLKLIINRCDFSNALKERWEVTYLFFAGISQSNKSQNIDCIKTFSLQSGEVAEGVFWYPAVLLKQETRCNSAPLQFHTDKVEFPFMLRVAFMSKLTGAWMSKTIVAFLRKLIIAFMFRLTVPAFIPHSQLCFCLRVQKRAPNACVRLIYKMKERCFLVLWCRWRALLSY